MAINWYLLNTKDLLGGCESSLSGYDGFSEALQTDIAVNVDLLNYDLTWKRSMRVIVQGNFPDNESSSRQRQILTVPGVCKAGMYIYYKEKYWLIVGLVSGNQIYEKAIVQLCNFKLTWIDENRNIAQRWVSIEPLSQKTESETGNDYYDVKNEGMYMLLPDDEISMQTKEGTRFIIDKRCSIYEKEIKPESTYPIIRPINVYKLKKIETIQRNYGNSGVIAFVAIQDETQDTDGCYLIANQKYWLCNYDESNPPIISYPNSAEILCDSPVLYTGIDPLICTAKFFDESGNSINYSNYTWEIICDFQNRLELSYLDNSISIYTDDPSLIGKDFYLVLKSSDFTDAEIKIEIKAFI